MNALCLKSRFKSILNVHELFVKYKIHKHKFLINLYFYYLFILNSFTFSTLFVVQIFVI